LKNAREEDHIKIDKRKMDYSEFVQECFFDCWNKYIPSTVETKHRDEIWEMIHTHYTESQRYYHTLQHLYELLTLFIEHSKTVEVHHFDIILWSIFFHDIIYIPTSKTNEEDSAILFHTLFSSLLTEEQCTMIESYIIATKNHREIAFSTTDSDLQFFLDLDLAILSTSIPNRYIEYAQQIRKEYQHIELAFYQRERAKFLRHHFLSTNNTTTTTTTTTTGEEAEAEKDSSFHIFATEYMQECFERQARENLLWEVEQLETAQFPVS
jgi:predicted metal-dependent HD superfamily phosphohydrolase